MTMTGMVVAGEFVPPGDPYRDDKDEPPREAGTYITIRLDERSAALVGGKVEVVYKPKT